MRIRFIGAGLHLLSGSGKPLYQLVDNLRKNNIDVNMLSDNLDNSVLSVQSLLLQKNQLNHVEAERTENITYGLLKGNKTVILAIKKFIRNADVIVTSDFLLALLLKKRGLTAKIPVVFIASNNLDFRLRFLIQAGLISTVNIFKRSFYSKLIFNRRFALRYILSFFDHIITTSNFVADFLVKLKLTVPILYLPVGINISSTSTSVPLPKNTFLYFGWGSGIRGLQDVIKAFELYKSSGHLGTLRISLQGYHGYEERCYFNRIKKSAFFDSIELGYFDENIRETILSSKAVILPFRVPFGYSQPPLAILESMALRRTVISTKIGCIPEIITHEKDGFLVTPGNPQEITDILVRLSDATAIQIGSNAYEKIKEIYDWDVVIKKYVQLFEKIVER